MKKWTICGSVMFLLLTLLTACGNKDEMATTMRLRKAEGIVRVIDDKNADLELLEGMGLYSGYQVDTQSKGYAWIDLDSVKLTKMDQETLVEIQKEGQKLEIIVKSGSLFFNITEPLGDDETMNIRTSTMTVGIRGTCGWVEVPEDGNTMRVYLLEGRVECTAGGEKKTVSAGEMAVMMEGGDITVEPFSAQDIPDYIREELEGDDDLADFGIDVKAPLHSPEEEMAIEQFRGIISSPDSIDFFDADFIGGGGYGYGQDFTGEYQYALVQVQAEDIAPTLLLRAIGQPEDSEAYQLILSDAVLMFRYDQGSQTTNPILDGYYTNGLMPIQTVEWETHIRYYDLFLGPDGAGLFAIVRDSLNDAVGVTQIGVQINRMVPIYEESMNYEYQDLQPITWYNTQDISGLDNWLSSTN